ncbi:DUF1617 family protein [Oceanobacillus alkalisoli]|uniref:DUF1617 family protein n=1 Tax=Oceanobacillus alkalisoli TaxID=2925113 RepID=UPI001F119DA6|nr:DUF1617 family protein [Oceanobacillus alkalisoli]MCF3942220.1 DUF1617 family protein [Oceanobacillus alkalisoli]
MKVELENGKLVAAANFLYKLKLVRKQSRMRRHLITILDERSKVYQEDKKELQEHHSNKDEDGKAIIHGDQYDIADMVAFSNDLKELNQEKLVIEGGGNREMIRTMKEILKKFEDEEYEGAESEIYDYLCDQFQIDENTEEEE